MTFVHMYFNYKPLRKSDVVYTLVVKLKVYMLEIKLLALTLKQLTQHVLKMETKPTMYTYSRGKMHKDYVYML